MAHISLDLETMGTGAFSPIISIGAVKFDPYTGELMEDIYIPFDLRDAERLGLRPNMDTVLWWMKQPEEAQQKFTHTQHLWMPVKAALKEFNNFVNPTENPIVRANTQIWGNGPTFDCGILRDSYTLANVKQPWDFWNERCVRTMKDIANIQKTDVPREGVHHDPRDDAAHQARIVSLAYKRLGL